MTKTDTTKKKPFMQSIRENKLCLLQYFMYTACVFILTYSMRNMDVTLTESLLSLITFSVLYIPILIILKDWREYYEKINNDRKRN